MPVHISPRPLRTAARSSRPFLRDAALRLLIAFAAAALATIALVHGYDSAVLLGAVVLFAAGMVRRNAEAVAL